MCHSELRRLWALPVAILVASCRVGCYGLFIAYSWLGRVCNGCLTFMQLIPLCFRILYRIISFLCCAVWRWLMPCAVLRCCGAVRVQRAAGDRMVYANNPTKNAEQGFVNNEISNTKYTPLTFLPKTLAEQFRCARPRLRSFPMLCS